jgi:4a-hydroxytetrahydrobiopterin dehydratase
MSRLGFAGMALLGSNEIEAMLADLDGWERQGDAIVKSFERGDFVGSVRFVDSLVEPAEAMGHHPDVAISWATVTVTISTHSEGGLTAADFELAGKIEALA